MNTFLAFWLLGLTVAFVISKVKSRTSRVITSAHLLDIEHELRRFKENNRKTLLDLSNTQSSVDGDLIAIRDALVKRLENLEAARDKLVGVTEAQLREAKS